MEMIPSIPTAIDRWATLRTTLSGAVIAPDDERYDQARLAWNLSVDQYPAVIVMPEDAHDALSAVRFARDIDLDIAVQATGHGVVRAADGAMLILTPMMEAVSVDPLARTAHIAAGVKWGKVLEMAQAYGLTPLLGSSPEVGAIGYTLGGGFGWLGRKYGLSLDSVNYFEVVTADGQAMIASATENPDLFWGLRGGGGSLAIVTAMEVKLYPVTAVYAGNLYYPIDQVRDVFIRYRDWIRSAPDELTSSILIMNYPPIPELPDFLRGQSYVQVRGCYCGSMDQGAELLNYWRDWRVPVVDDFKEIPFTQVATISSDPVDPLPGLSSGAWVRELGDELIDAMIQFGAGPISPLIMAEIRHVGGAVSRVDACTSAYGSRQAQHLLQTVGLAPSREIHEELQRFNNRMKEAMQPYLTGGVYPNFLEGLEAQERIVDAYSRESYRRLRELKLRYDPDNRFGYSYNIKPAC